MLPRPNPFGCQVALSLWGIECPFKAVNMSALVFHFLTLALPGGGMGGGGFGGGFGGGGFGPRFHWAKLWAGHRQGRWRAFGVWLAGLLRCHIAMVVSSAFAGRTVTEVVPIDRVFVQLNTRNTGPHLARKVRGGIVVAFLHRNVEMPLLRSSHCCTFLKRIFHMASSFGCDFWCSAVQVVSKSRLSLVAGLGAWQGKAYTCLYTLYVLTFIAQSFLWKVILCPLRPFRIVLPLQGLDEVGIWRRKLCGRVAQSRQTNAFVPSMVCRCLRCQNLPPNHSEMGWKGHIGKWWQLEKCRWVCLSQMLVDEAGLKLKVFACLSSSN